MSHDLPNAITQKIWDPTSVEQTLNALVQQISAQAGVRKSDVRVTLSGPRTFTIFHKEPEQGTGNS
ncbi:hypothetical protein PUN71_016680 [Arthrobacter sp. NQ7]|uniref:hypothetical protein n=1 Tax=Arthrobacter sp. NQ7 TaxID=3032303 RepID=UPI00240F8150|nr:hypothetical protein [Arthrobacter sp. NQ7]MDJ0458841.1 hypothetical protein [Arthrobacter sp. NQ7]